MMSKLKLRIGDSVRILKSEMGNDKIVGAIGTIVDIDEDWIYPYEVEYEREDLRTEAQMGNVEELFDDSDLELIGRDIDAIQDMLNESLKILDKSELILPLNQVQEFTANELIVVACDDWQGLYVNGELEYEGHSIDNNVWVDVINEYNFFKGVTSYYVIDNKYMHDRGSFPEKFSELPRGILV